MTELSVDLLFDAAVRIQLLERAITVSFAPDRTIRITFPTTRHLAEFLALPHSVVLRSCAMMEHEELVTKAERVGIITTKKGSRIIIDLMREKYRKESEGILGAAVFEELYNRTR
jgi:DNA-binding transcriptional regulator YhcF (GntR family)